MGVLKRAYAEKINQMSCFKITMIGKTEFHFLKYSKAYSYPRLSMDHFCGAANTILPPDSLQSLEVLSKCGEQREIHSLAGYILAGNQGHKKAVW